MTKEYKVMQNDKDVFNIIEGKDGKSRWVKIGQAFVNRDGSINVFLDAFPKDGKLQIRDRRKIEVQEFSPDLVRMDE